ncbi:MAG: bis-aminopropyl spermidine synthase family protein [Caldimicrobium sp.]|nr:bis-aminopropyl spermidine synthase family protein [Caldimicrobium sp.]MCX7613184.1 bis-aminopropyl spermidine synthase family protein [Caldimicrobium sp.]MDW8182514.1 bis-aminopropyl spermidine synthase family protein [Caldimicrobium sp.]
MLEIDRIKKQILRSLAKGQASFWELINYQDSHIVNFLEALKELLNSGKIRYQKPYFQLNEHYSSAEKYHHPGCLFCQPFKEDPFWQKILEDFKSLTRERPLPTSDYDQGFIRPEDTLKRAAFIYERGDLEDCEIFILGDDDLLSIALALIGLPKKIVVVEIDQRINDFIAKKMTEIGYKDIEIHNYNVLDSLPEVFLKKFDVFVTDPVETQKGLKLFVSRCISTLKGKGSTGYLGFTHREASLQKWRDFQRFMLDSGFVITDILRDFTTYPEKENSWVDFYRTYRIMKEFDLELPDVDWYKSCFLRFEVVEGPYLFDVPTPADLEELYFDEEAWATPLPSYLEKK